MLIFIKRSGGWGGGWGYFEVRRRKSVLILPLLGLWIHVHIYNANIDKTSP